MAPYRAQNIGGIANSGIYPRPAGPDWGAAIDSVFRSTADAVRQRAYWQQQAQASRDANARQQQQIQIQQARLEMDQQAATRKEEDAANALIIGGHDEVDPNIPQLAPDGKPLPMSRVGNRAFVLNPARTKEGQAVAQRKAALSSLGGALKPGDIEILANNQGAFDSYVAAQYGPASKKETPEEKVETAVAIAKATRGIPTYSDLHPKPPKATGGNEEGGVSTGDVRKEAQAEKFAQRYVDMFMGNAPAAVAYIEKNPDLKRKAQKLGVTEGHYNQATTRRSGKAKAGKSDDAFEAAVRKIRDEA